MYYCEFPLKCDYSTSCRTQIHYHHIVPLELGGVNKSSNRIWLCPTHHTHIYIPEAKKGHHSIQSEHSVILLGWRASTMGRVLIFKRSEDGELEIV